MIGKEYKLFDINYIISKNRITFNRITNCISVDPSI